MPNCDDAGEIETAILVDEGDEAELSKAQTIGCLACIVAVLVAMVVPKAIALWQGLHSDGTWIYPPIGILVFWVLAINTLLTGKIPYRSEDMDLREYPALHYGAVVVFGLAAFGMYWLYLAMIFGW